MDLTIKVSAHEEIYGKLKTASALVNAVCGILDNAGFKVEFIDYTLDEDEELEDDSNE